MGTPQGGPLSPLLSNILLDDLDKEPDKRGHRFVRYADDCNVYVRSRPAGERVLASLERFLTEKLRLKVNPEKSAVARPWERKFLGYTVTVHRRPKLRVSPQSVEHARASACNGRGPWWNAGQSHMNQAFPIAELRKLGLLSLLEQHRRFACVP